MTTEILIGDCIEQMRGLESGSVDAIGANNKEIKMYLYVEMFDGWQAFNESQFGCSLPSSCRRVVKVDLTPEQVEALRPRECGKNGGRMMYESVNPICIQTDD